MANTTLLIGHLLCFFFREGRKKIRVYIYQNINTTSRDAYSDPNLTEATKNCNTSVISVIQFGTVLWPPTEYAVKRLRS